MSAPERGRGLGCLWLPIVALVCFTVWRIAVLVVTGKP